MSRAYYSTTIENFLLDDPKAIVGQLNLEISTFRFIWTRTTTSWFKSIELLKQQLSLLLEQYNNARNWTIIFEYEIPRLLNRIDVVILAEELIFVIEYKDDRKEYKISDKRQAEDYALDLKDFHSGSYSRTIIPILLAPAASNSPGVFNIRPNDFIQDTICTNADNFSEQLYTAFKKLHNPLTTPIDPVYWINSSYRPTPTIIQAAQALFAGHSVEDISISGATNLSETTDYVAAAIEKAKTNKQKIICFVTGVPGAGKTLVGLNLIHRKNYNEENESNAAYFSGNGPLIKVLREALSEDDKNRALQHYKLRGGDVRPKKGESAKKIESKIQNLHKFIKDGLRGNNKTFEKIVVFDEAQRCWNGKHFHNQTKRNQNREADPIDAVNKSEAEILFEIMDKHDWAVIVALVGNGQEINTGEAGIQEWGKTIQEKYKHWEVYVSDKLITGSSEIDGAKLFENTDISDLKIYTNEAMHLSVSQRTFKANKLNDWVNAILNNDPEQAKNIIEAHLTKYPVFITRDLKRAKEWLRKQKHGNKKIGLVASSGAQRLRPYGITTKGDIDEVIWFLEDEDHVGSSDYLEVAATEFSIQGLEIDWSCICWDADLRRHENKWDVKSFAGKKWNNTKDFNFIVNTYRVLLTRAREGMIIWIPEGDKADATRLPEFYDPIYAYLISCGVPDIS